MIAFKINVSKTFSKTSDHYKSDQLLQSMVQLNKDSYVQTSLSNYKYLVINMYIFCSIIFLVKPRIYI